MENLPVLRKVKAGRDTDEPMPKEAFTNILDKVSADYTHKITIHAVRRGLGKKIDGRSLSRNEQSLLIENRPVY